MYLSEPMEVLPNRLHINVKSRSLLKIFELLLMFTNSDYKYFNTEHKVLYLKIKKPKCVEYKRVVVATAQCSS